MPAVELDVAAIPDMIEAQLTLSYSRLAQLVRLIVDQGNGHDLDIDKLTSRMDMLARENAELRSLVKSLMEERKTSSEDVRRALETLRDDIAHVSNACGQNAERISTVVAQSAERQASVDSYLKDHMERAEAAVQQSSAASAALADNARVLEQALHAAEDFVALWGSDASRAASLSRRGDIEGAEATSAKQCTEYLHSLPAFMRVFEELEVVRQMLRQNAADALAVKSVAGTMRRSASTEAAAAAAAAAASERSAVEALQAALEDMDRRVRAVETKRLLPLEHAVRCQRPSSALLPSQEENHTEGGTVLKQTAQQPWASQEEISILAERMHNLEGRLRGLMFKAKDGATMEEAVLSDMDGRIRVLEGVVEGSSRKLQQSHEQEQEEGGKQEQVKQKRKQEEQQPPSGTNRASGTALGTSSSHQLPKKNMNGDESASPQAPLPIDQPKVEFYRRQSSLAGAIADPENHVQFSLQQEDGLRRRVTQLEENCAVLEMHKASRLELHQLEQALVQSLSTANLRVGPQQHHRQQEYQTNAAGQVSAGYHPYPMFGQQLPGVPYMPQRPASAQNGQSASDGHMAYTTEGASGAVSVPSIGGGTGGPGRPMFIRSNSQFLRDTMGSKTPATIAPSYRR